MQSLGCVISWLSIYDIPLSGVVSEIDNKDVIAI